MEGWQVRVDATVLDKLIADRALLRNALTLLVGASEPDELKIMLGIALALPSTPDRNAALNAIDVLLKTADPSSTPLPAPAPAPAPTIATAESSHAA